MKHGASGYTNGKCRCEVCREAHRVAGLRWSQSPKGKAADAQRYADNRTEILARKRQRRPEIREATRAYERARAQTPAGRQRSHSRRGVKFTPAAIEYLSIISDDPCSYCGAKSATVDHIIPISAGGDGGWMNLTPACLPCNSGKRDRPLLTYLLGRSIR